MSDAATSPRAAGAGADLRTRASEAAVHAAVLGGLFALTTIPDGSLDRFHLPKELVVELAAAIAIATARVRRLDALDLGLLGVVAATLASTLLAIEPWTAARAAALTTAFASLAMAARRLPGDARERLRSTALAGAGCVAALALLETFGIVRDLSGPGRAPGATLGQRNAVAHVLALALPLAWRAALRGPRAPIGWLATLAAAVMTGAIVATRSRAGWIAAALAVLVFALAAGRVRSRRIALAWPALATLAGALAVAMVRSRLRWHASRPYLDTLERLVDVGAGSGLGRVIQYRASLALVPDDPLLGVGPGCWSIAYPQVTPPGDPSFDADAWEPVGRLLTSDVVAWLVERGVLGLLASACAIVVWARALREVDDRELRAAWAAGGAALLVVSALDSVLQLAAPLAMVAAIAAAPLRDGGGIADGIADRIAGAPSRSVVRTARWAPAIAALLVVAGVGSVAHRAIQLAGLSLHASERASLAELERARALDPGDYPARAALGRGYLRRRRCADALAVLDEAARLRPHHPVVLRARDGARRCASAAPPDAAPRAGGR